MAKSVPTAAVLVSPSMVRDVATRVFSLRITILATLLFLFLAVNSWALPERHTFTGLAQQSEMIVVARVECVQGSRVIGKRWATARVREVWKGPNVETVRFLASRRRESWSTRLSACYLCCYDSDITDARKGELVILFLKKEENVGWVILDKGRGRFPLITRNGKSYLTDPPPEVREVDTPDDRSELIPAAELSTVRAFVQNVAD